MKQRMPRVPFGAEMLFETGLQAAERFRVGNF